MSGANFARNASGGGGFGSARKLDAFQAIFTGVAPVGGADIWPNLAFRAGGVGGGLGPYARVGGGASGFGGTSGFPVGSSPQLTWLEGPSNRGYAINMPVRLFSQPGEDCPPDQQVFICGGHLKWETTTAPGVGVTVGSFVTAWAGTGASIITNPMTGAAAGARCFGICRQPVTGQFGFAAVNGVTVTFTPLVHPAGDVRIPVWVEYRITNARLGNVAILDVLLNNEKKIRASFIAGNTAGLFSAYASDVQAGLTMTTFAETAQRIWHGQQYFAWGPNTPDVF